jgi:hypothetical protein
MLGKVAGATVPKDDDMKVQRQQGGKVPCVLHLDTRRRCVVSFTWRTVWVFDGKYRPSPQHVYPHRTKVRTNIRALSDIRNSDLCFWATYYKGRFSQFHHWGRFKSYFLGGGGGSRPTTGIKRKTSRTQNKVEYTHNMHKFFSYMFRHSMGAIIMESS